MAKIFFIPFSVVGSLIAGLIARKGFDRVWSMIDDEDPPEPADRHASLQKVLIAVVLQSGVFAIARAVSDRQARRAFAHLTGSWPGDDDSAR